MGKVCPHCGASAIEVDEEGKLEVCSICGVVCNEGSFQNDTKFQSQQQKSFRREEENWRTKRLYSIINRNLMRSKKLMVAQAERLRLPREYILQIEEKLKEIYAKQLYKGLPRNKKAVVGSCVYIVCRQNDMVLTIKNVSEAARCDMSVLARCVRMLTAATNVHLEVLEPDQFITNILSQFEIKDPSTKNLVQDLFRFCTETMICSGKKIVLTVMALVCMSIECINGSPVSITKCQEVCRMNTVKREHVLRFVRQYRLELFKFAKKIPWISPTLKEKKIATVLKEIVEYYKDCEDHRKVDFKPKWQERKELVEKEKKQKLEKAEERILACQVHCGNVESIDDDLCLHKICKEIPSTLTKHPSYQLYPLSSSMGTSTITLEVATQDKKVDSDHVCCPHCCVTKHRCPVYHKNGVTDFCLLDRYDRIVESLLRKGYSKQELIEGNPESIFYSENYNPESVEENEELDDNDISEHEIHLYIKTDSEVAQTKALKKLKNFSDLSET